MITLKWAQYPEADVGAFKVYRSIIGFRALLPPAVTVQGKTLILKMNGGANQTITFSTANLIADINAVLTGGRAYLSDNALSVFVRSDIRVAPGSVQIVGGSALADFGLTPRTITEKSEDELVSTITAPVDPDDLVEFNDPDGTLGDWYALSTVDSLSNESSKTGYRQPISATGPLCVLEGLVYDLQGVRIPDAEVKATIQNTPQGNPQLGNITQEPIITRSGSDGRYSLPLLQKALVRLEIPAIGYTQMVTVPEKAFVFVNDLSVDPDYRYP